MSLNCLSAHQQQEHHISHGSEEQKDQSVHPKRKSRKRRPKLPLAAVKLLDDWFAQHRKNPYPTNAERDQLIMSSGLTKKQVNTWFMNARRRQLDPLTAWLSASSEDEAVPVKNILQAMGTVTNNDQHNIDIQSPKGFSNLLPTLHLSTGAYLDRTISPDSVTFQPGYVPGNEEDQYSFPYRQDGSAASSCGSAFDQCPEATWCGPPKQGRKAYGSPGLSRSHSAQNSIANFNGQDADPSPLPFPADGSSDTGFQDVPKLWWEDMDQNELYIPSPWQIMTSRPPAASPYLSTRPNSFTERLLATNTHISVTERKGETPEFPAHLTPIPLSIEMSTETDTDTYTCNYHGCMLRFETPQKLRKHKREVQHNAPRTRPHKCERFNPTTGKPCDMTFLYPYDLTCHEKTVHNIPMRKVRCALCIEEKTFSRSYALTHHMQVVHPEVDFPGQYRRRGEHSQGEVQGGQRVLQSRGSANEDKTDPFVHRKASGDDVGVELNHERKDMDVMAKVKYNNSPLFQCTFCRVKISGRSWKRHEETQHLPRKKWTCIANGKFSDEFYTACIFCGETNVDYAHGERCVHRIAECLERPDQDRDFMRKDHLKQHLKQFHNVSLDEKQIAAWGIGQDTTELERIWKCGFCGLDIKGWDARATHISAHFRQGCDMSTWDSNKPSPNEVCLTI
jgi:hypothetical protein